MRPGSQKHQLVLYFLSLAASHGTSQPWFISLHWFAAQLKRKYLTCSFFSPPSSVPFSPSAAAKLLELQGQCQHGVCLNLLLCVLLALMGEPSSSSACLSNSVPVSVGPVFVSLKLFWRPRQILITTRIDLMAGSNCRAGL